MHSENPGAARQGGRSHPSVINDCDVGMQGQGKILGMQAGTALTIAALLPEVGAILDIIATTRLLVLSYCTV